MEELKFKIKAIAAVVAVLVILGVAGRCDYAEEVLCDMPASTYKYMKNVAPDATDYDIAKLYNGREGYWDELAIEKGY